MTATTDLVLSTFGVPPYSARGLSQTLTPIQQSANVARTINGSLINLSDATFQKYNSTITGDDQQPPSVEAFWPGQQITVDCIVELAYPTATGSASRTVVSSRTEGDFTFYFPRLTMMLLDFQIERDEYGDVVSWSMALEEV